jgi:catechol 2,3-dioxygenase
MQRAERPIDPNLRIGHVHLRTADIDRVREFYVGILGFDVVHEARDVPGWGTTGDILFVSAGGYHHHLGFNTWKSAGGSPQPATSTHDSWTIASGPSQATIEVQMARGSTVRVRHWL